MAPPLRLALVLASTLSACASLPATVAEAPAPAPLATDLDNPAIDMAGFLATAQAAAVHRESRRVDEAQFLRLMAEPGTVVLDARSAEKYAQLHVRGAINLSFPDIAIDSLARAIPDKDTRILIYCNNNFAGAEEPFPSKIARASLNLSTVATLYGYGYRNVVELGPQVVLEESTLPFEGTLAGTLVAQ
jgi:phage shock protein E